MVSFQRRLLKSLVRFSNYAKCLKKERKMNYGQVSPNSIQIVNLSMFFVQDYLKRYKVTQKMEFGSLQERQNWILYQIRFLNQNLDSKLINVLLLIQMKVTLLQDQDQDLLVSTFHQMY